MNTATATLDAPAPAPAATAPTARIPVGGQRPYDVVLGTGLLGGAGRLLGPGPLRVAVVYGRAVRTAARRVAAGLVDEGRIVVSLEVPDGEPAKDPAVLLNLWRAFADAELSGGDAVVAVGGGATTDLAGFAAAGWQGGVRLVLVPTTLLGMAVAADARPAAVNLPPGKNLLAAHHPPAGVLCDLDLLDTLPPAGHAAGLAAILRTAFVADPPLLDAAASRTDTRLLLDRALRAAARLTAGPADRRAHLDYGLTFGHALERATGHRVPHGHALAVGMVYAAELARLAGRLTGAEADRHRELLAAAGLPTACDAGWLPLRTAMNLDAHTRGTRPRLVVLDAIGCPALLTGPPEDLLTAAWRKVHR
ncbi:3-dehydroquinate synthase family protein [Streptomyces sp. NPDC090022]|uniref:3-dehydroquinate synthase family protein n=1 Tax=Streptomyces sp. NPDC090022 TaxID=3365920 RepID=UPI0037F64174